MFKDVWSGFDRIREWIGAKNFGFGLDEARAVGKGSVMNVRRGEVQV